MYSFNNINIPQGVREQLNNNIINLITSGDLQGVTPEDIFNSFTGIGGLHGLKRSDFESYSEYSDEKKEIEKGQFFTPADVCGQMVNMLGVSNSDLVGEMCCGSGNFLNYLPNLNNVYGCEIEENSLTVAKFLYPQAHLENCDFRFYSPQVLFDYVIGNPPFNLRLLFNDRYSASQDIYIKRAAEMLKPGGILAFICPFAFLNDSLYYNNLLDVVNHHFNFIAAVRLPVNIFSQYGAIFETKVLVFQRKADCIKEQVPFDGSLVCSSFAEAKELIQPVLKHKETLKAVLLRELVVTSKDNQDLNFKINKCLFEIKHQKKLKDYYPKALSLLEQLKTQQKPVDMKPEEWEDKKLTPKKILSRLQRYVKNQNFAPKDEIKLVKTSYGIKYKAYSKKAQIRLNSLVKSNGFDLNDIVIGKSNDIYRNVEGVNYDYFNYFDLIARKKADYALHSQAYRDMPEDHKIKEYLDAFCFDTPKEKGARFGDVQKLDLNRVLQKKYSILGWQQGSGKTPGSYAWGMYRMRFNYSRNVFILSSGISVNITWTDFFTLNKVPFVNIQSLADLEKVKRGDFVLVSVDFLLKYEQQIKRFVKRQSQKVAFIFDESDEITNALSKRSKAALNCFRRARYKLLATGTTTRNNINELYSQLELLYNNSYNFLCECATIYKEVHIKKKDSFGGDYGTQIRILENKDNYFKPFKAFRGKNLFMYCFNPSKKTVFGIEKNNQDVYNSTELGQIVERSIITRKFKEIAGPDRYKITHHAISMNEHERQVYNDLLENASRTITMFYNSTGNSRKDAMLRALHQLQLLIKATSIPQVFPAYSNKSLLPSKFQAIFSELDRLHDCKVAIGCTTTQALDLYIKEIFNRFPFRPLFVITGEVSFKKRKQVIKNFEATSNGILICTQQALKNSVNIPSCKEVFMESMQWNFPKMEQFYFRFIRYNSVGTTNIHFFTYERTIEVNLLSLVVAKESLNDFIKTLDFKDEEEMMQELDFDLSVVETLLVKEVDSDGKVKVTWGQRNVA